MRATAQNLRNFGVGIGLLVAVLMLAITMAWVQAWQRFDQAVWEPTVVGQAVASEQSRETVVYTLYEGWNFIAFPFRPITVKTAKELIQDVQLMGGYVTTVSRWDGDRWQEFSQRGNEYFGHDYELVPGEAYFVRNHRQVEWIITGLTLPLNETYGQAALKPGWNAVGLLPGRIDTAEAVLDAINTGNVERATEIDRWISGNWDVFVKRIYSPTNIREYGHNFKLESNRGYMIKMLTETSLRTRE
jgi:hypothetical protein